MRWNPNISSYTMERFYNDLSKHRACSNWSIWDHESARSGDLYFMARVGTEHDGIVWGGYLDGPVYRLKSKATGELLKGHYVDTTWQFIQDIERRKAFTAAKLQQVLPAIDWHHGHSGIQLSEDDAETLALFLGNEMLHLRESKTLLFDDYEQRHYVITSMITYLCPKLKCDLLAQGRFTNPMIPQKAITDVGVNYDDKLVKADTRLEDILTLEKINGELVLSPDFK